MKQKKNKCSHTNGTQTMKQNWNEIDFIELYNSIIIIRNVISKLLPYLLLI